VLETSFDSIWLDADDGSTVEVDFGGIVGVFLEAAE